MLSMREFIVLVMGRILNYDAVNNKEEEKERKRKVGWVTTDSTLFIRAITGNRSVRWKWPRRTDIRRREEERKKKGDRDFNSPHKPVHGVAEIFG